MYIKTKSKRNLHIAIGICLVLVGIVSFFIMNNQKAYALTGWKAGNIISNYVMSNKNTMSASSIQSFLNSKVPTCDTYGAQQSEYGGGTRAQYGERYHNQSTFTCLKNYSENGKKASQIIYEKAQKYSINPQVLLVLLQKEQGLVTDDWPVNIQYKTATGYGCPDTAPCDEQYFGLTNQLDWSAKMFRAILDDSPYWYTPYELGNNYIQYNPDSSCGGSNVYIENRATQALYNYTPYQPNKAALDAGFGSAPCGAYGNRNFYIYFNNWFGTTSASIKYSSLSNPRDMQLVSSIRKTSLTSGQPIDGTLSAGQVISFAESATFGGKVYFRTAHDKSKGLDKGILASNIVDTPIELSGFLSPRNLQLKKDTNSYNLSNGMPDLSQDVNKGDIYFFTHKTLRGDDKLYFVSDQQYSNGSSRAYRATDLEEVLDYGAMKSPRKLALTTDTYKTDLRSGKSVYSKLPAGSEISFSETYSYNGKFYLRTAHDAKYNIDRGILYSNLKELTIKYSNFVRPRTLVLTKDSTEYSIVNGTKYSEIIPAGTELYFTTKTSRSDGRLYFRTQQNSIDRIDVGIDSSDLGEK